MYIRDKGKIVYLTGDKIEPPITNAQHAVWDSENSMVMSWLVNSMEEVISANYLGFSTAKEMWTSLEQMYSDMGNQSQIYKLELKIGSTQAGHRLNLDVEFDEVQGRIIGRQPLPSLNDVFAEVRREESRRTVLLGKKISEPSPVKTYALVSQEVVAHKA
ncbi:hypothetical protein EZV62_014574 [Acer yangbiense]|uniref:Retrotransposon Copia-like N-terminal domain-containing protein n=1 Tax=Acer yangbiense TaxID=1000413 RepID=A0A5C7HSK4_9ROSI|nr:hypothetical protein EZV62_014574 [Acer yangbiense]